MPCSLIYKKPFLLFTLLALVFSLWAGASSSGETLIHRFDDGSIRSEIPVDDFGLPHGLKKEFNSKGNLISERTFEHGTLEGPSRLFYPEGPLKTELHYKEGKREGLSVGYYRDGTVKDKGLYQNDLLEGQVFLYFPNGHLKAQLNFKEDRQHGLSRTYYESGRLRDLFDYRKGRLIRRETYGPQGQLLQEQDFSTSPSRP